MVQAPPKPIPPCDICGDTNITERNCKVICNNCGYVRDCSDPYRSNHG